MTDVVAPPQLGADELKTLFLFEALTDDQLNWLSSQGYVENRAAGEFAYDEGDDATCFFVLLSGTVATSKKVEDTHVETARTNQRGVYGGATVAFLRSEEVPKYQNSMLAVTECQFWVIDAPVFGSKFREWFPMAMHMMEGLALGMRSSQIVVGQRERLLSLGRLSAGLTHELNNPAAAAVRATASLRERVAKMRNKLAHLATADIAPEALVALTDLQEAAVERMAKAEKLSPMETGDREDELGDWLDDHDVKGGWDIAPTLVAAGV
ncbi:MAG: cyclic nucleotide-binding domain-containing protein, partial [Propionibacteriaceae bacterium]